MIFIDHTWADICATWQWECNNGQCIHDDYKCDREYDCSDNSDESDAACRKSNVSKNNLAYASKLKFKIITIVIVNLSFESNIIVGTYEIERSRACREESRVSGFSLYDAKLACSATAWCEMFYQKDDGFYFCSYGETYYDRYATLYRKPSKLNPNIWLFIVNHHWFT